MNRPIVNINPIALMWLKSNRLTPAYKKRILALNKNEINAYFSDIKLNFGTAGIRTTIGPGTNQMNFFTYQQIAEGYSRWLLNNFTTPTVVVAHDNRLNAKYYSKVVANVLSSFGIKVILFKNNEITATPILSYAIRKHKTQGGINITASHNPKNYLGIKLYKENGAQIRDEDAYLIRELMPNNTDILNKYYLANKQLIFEFDDSIKQAYIQDSLYQLPNTNPKENKNFPFIYTAHHGAGSVDYEKFIKAFGYNGFIPVREQNFEDPYFSNSPSSNPEDIASFGLALEYANKFNAEIILASDPDADRLGVATLNDHDWVYLSGNEVGIIFTYYLLTTRKYNRKPFIVSTLVSNTFIDRIARKFNADVYRVGVGFKEVGNAIDIYMNQQDFVVAFEEAIGSITSITVRDKDSFQSGALMLEIYNFLSERNITLIEYLNHIYDEFGYWSGGTVSYLIQGSSAKALINQKLDFFKNAKLKHFLDYKIEKRYPLKDVNAFVWELQGNNKIIFRPSGTEPKFKVYFDLYSTDIDKAKDLLKYFQKGIDELVKNS